MTTKNIEEVFTPKYLQEADGGLQYFENVIRPELELQAVRDWETNQANQE
jgi:hypothetical protein